MTIESIYSKELDALLEEYSMFGYVVLDSELKEAIRVLNGRYQT
jgi:hypothetical protein